MRKIILSRKMMMSYNRHMIKMIFMMVFWSAVALGAVYGFAMITGDYALQSKITFICNNVIYSVTQWWQGVKMAVQGWIASAQRMAEGGMPQGVDVQDLVKSVKIPTKQ